jgi:hypothetical protein
MTLRGDQEVARCLDRLEQLLATPLDAPNGQAFADWNTAFQAALAGAARGPEWPALRVRARILGRRLKHREVMIRAAQAQVQRDMGQIGSGRRALGAYGPAARIRP